MISSRANPIIKRARALRQPRARSESGWFLVEGIHPVAEALEAGWDIEAVLYAPDKLKSGFARAMLGRYPGRIEQVSAPTLASVSGKDHPQGIIAIVRQRNCSIGDVRDIKRGVALVSPQDPGNVGTILRTLDAVQCDGLFLLDGGVDQYHPTVIRAGMGASFWIPVVCAAFLEFENWARSGHFQLIGTSARGGIDPAGFEAVLPWILVLGSEQKGLGPREKQVCDVILTLPMRGRASSLNLAVAAGILLYGLVA